MEPSYIWTFIPHPPIYTLTCPFLLPSIYPFPKLNFYPTDDKQDTILSCLSCFKWDPWLKCYFLQAAYWNWSIPQGSLLHQDFSNKYSMHHSFVFFLSLCDYFCVLFPPKPQPSRLKALQFRQLVLFPCVLPMISITTFMHVNFIKNIVVFSQK